MKIKDEDKDAKIAEMFDLLLEARDALPAITMSSAKLRNIDLTLASRIEDCLEPWRVKQCSRCGSEKPNSECSLCYPHKA